MTYRGLTLRHLCFTGPSKNAALVRFNPGLNVLYGASETGKSFVLEAIDFMLGGRNPLRDVGEREGYDRIFLGVEDSEQSKFTLVRAAAGGQFQVFEGLHENLPKGQEGKILPLKASKKYPIAISAYLLDRIGLAGRRILKNKSNDLLNLSFRNIAHLCLVSEEQIHKVSSPIETGQVISKTPEFATFKLLLTGVDDSAIVGTTSDSSVSQSRSAKIEMLDELLVDLRKRHGNEINEPTEKDDQLERLEISLERGTQALHASEEQYQTIVKRRGDVRRQLEIGVERRSEISELLARFDLLAGHYASDLARLDAISEAGSLVAALSPQTCPLCGASPESQHQLSTCDGNLEDVVAAADSEKAKIVRLQKELQQTMSELGREASSFDALMPKLRSNLNDIETQLNELEPDITQQRVSYRELVDQQSEIRSSLAIWDQFAELEAKRMALESAEDSVRPQAQAATGLSTSTLDKFAQQIEKLLKAWNFPDAERVYFDNADRDLIIKGRRRGSRGKGMRAITHAAFSIGLMEYCHSNSRPHPGFVVLDSPLLAYREPDGTEDDLDGTDVQVKLYDYLAKKTEMQVLVIENIDPPESIRKLDSSTFFSKNPHQGRYGLFPMK